MESTRRAFCLLLAAAARGQTKPVIPVRTLNHMTLIVSDVKRSVNFYQGLFGMPIQARQGNTVVLRIGPGPQFMALSEGGPSARPAIGHFCMTTGRFDLNQILDALGAHGVKSETGAGRGGPMKVRVRVRREDDGGAKEGTPEVYVSDPDGLVVQLQHPGYCGGAGQLGNVCSAPLERPARKGLLALRDLNHFTLYVSNKQRSSEFYKELFGMPVQAWQGSTPLYRVGSGPQFVAIAQSSRANGATPGRPKIAHACLTVEGFHPDKVMKLLAGYGLKRKSDAGEPAGPLTSYLIVRKEDRGGAKGGTPELYFSDPDGILLQLQDVSYCGGSGYLGEVCA